MNLLQSPAAVRPMSALLSAGVLSEMAPPAPGKHSRTDGAMRYLLPGEERKLLSTIKSRTGLTAKRDFHMFGLMLQTGIRVGTMVQLSVRDASDALDDGFLRLRDEISKGHHGYELPLVDETRGHLKALLMLRKEHGLGLPFDRPLLVSRVQAMHGQGVTVRAVQKRLEFWRKQAEISAAVTPHWLRHTKAQRIIRNSGAANPLAVAQKLLGHRNISSTAIYTKPSREETLDALKATQ